MNMMSIAFGVALTVTVFGTLLGDRGAALAQTTLPRTVTLGDCDNPARTPGEDSEKCPLAPGELNPESLRLKPGLDKAVFFQRLQDDIETATARLIAESKARDNL